MNEKLAKAWAETEATGKAVPIGDVVVCDVCDLDFTSSEQSGGFIFGSYAYCSACAAKALPDIKSYGEDRLIRACCPPGQSFADFVREFRGPNASVRVSSW